MAGEKEVASLFITLRANSEKLGSDLSSLQGKIALKGRAIGNALAAAIATGITLGIGYAVKAAMGFEEALADVQMAAKISPDGIKALGSEIKELSKTIPVAVTDLAKLAAVGAGLGVPAEELSKFVTIASKLSIAFGMTAEEAGDAMLKLSKIWKLPLDGIEEFGDAVDILGDRTGATAKGIMEAMLKIGSTGEVFGLTANETAALTASLIALGQQPRKVGTAVNNLLIPLENVTKQSKEFKMALWEVTGMKIPDFQAMMKVDPGQGLMAFLESLSKLNGEELTSKIEAMFGQGSVTAIATLVSNLDQYKNALALANNEQERAGNLDQAFMARSQTTAAQWQLLKNAITVVAIELGTAMLPAVTALAEALVAILTPIATLIQTFPEISKWATTGTVGLWAFSKILGIVGANLLGLANLMATTVVAAFTSVIAGLRALTIAALANPILAILAALSIAATVIIYNWEPLKNFFNNFWNEATTKWEQFKTTVMGVFTNVKSVVTNAIDTMILKIHEWMGKIEALKNKLATLLGLGKAKLTVSASTGEGGSSGGGGGFARGGSFSVGGSGPTDTSLVAFMATPGERVTVETPGQQRMAARGEEAGGAIIQNINVSTGVQETIRAELISLLPTLKQQVINTMGQDFRTRQTQLNFLRNNI